jgi:hypothetical protein
MSDEQRSITRFQSQPESFAHLSFDLKSKEFKKDISALLINESFGGLSLVLTSDSPIKLKQKVRLQVGSNPVVKAVVVWSKTLEENIQKIGLSLL